MSFTDFASDVERIEFDRQCDESEREWIKGALESRDETEADWRRQGYIFARVGQKPAYVTAIDWWIYARVPNPKAPGTRITRLDLIGGGQIKVIEKFEIWPYPDNGMETWTYCPHDLRITAHCGEAIKRARGTYEIARPNGPSEIDCHAVVFPAGTDQGIADRVAATFEAIGDNHEHFFALLLGGQNCAFCNRPLRDELSRLIGVGPDCARQWGVPHSKAAAEQRLALRRRLLGVTAAAAE